MVHSNGPEPHVQELSLEEFVERFERPRLPAVITGLCESWRAATDWDEAGLLRRFSEHKFKVSVPQLAGKVLSAYLAC